MTEQGVPSGAPSATFDPFQLRSIRSWQVLYQLFLCIPLGCNCSDAFLLWMVWCSAHCDIFLLAVLQPVPSILAPALCAAWFQQPPQGFCTFSRPKFDFATVLKTYVFQLVAKELGLPLSLVPSFASPPRNLETFKERENNFQGLLYLEQMISFNLGPGTTG